MLIGDSIDLRQLAEMREIAGGDFAAIVIRYTETARQMRDTFAAYCTNNDAAGLRRVTHKFKGSSASLGLLKVAGLCGKLEEYAARGALSEAQSCLEQLTLVLEEALAYLESEVKRSAIS